MNLQIQIISKRIPKSNDVSRQAIKERYFMMRINGMMQAVSHLLDDEQAELVHDFFKNHLFMPADRQARDLALEGLHQKMGKVNIMGFADNLRESVELARLSNSLDDSLLSILEGRDFDSLDELTEAELGSALQQEGRFDERRQQVRLLINNITFFHKIANTPMVSMFLPSMKMFAKGLGVACLTEQIDAGYKAARSIKSVDRFTEALWENEENTLSLLGAV